MAVGNLLDVRERRKRQRPPANMDFDAAGLSRHRRSDRRARSALGMGIDFLKVDCFFCQQKGGNVATDPSLQETDGCFPLFHACRAPRNVLEIVHALFEAGADSLLADDLGHNGLHLAAVHSHTDVIREFLRCSPTVLDSNGNAFMTPLCVAASRGRDIMVPYLLNERALQLRGWADGLSADLADALNLPLPLAYVSRPVESGSTVSPDEERGYGWLGHAIRFPVLRSSLQPRSLARIRARLGTNTPSSD